MESEALLTLRKLESIMVPARPIMKRAAEGAVEDSQNRYRKAWGRREDRVAGVYSALKKAIFGSRMSGRLTGSTLRAIKPRYDKNIAGVSIDGTWPDVQGNTRHKVAVQKVIDELKAANGFRPAGFHGTGNVKERKQYHGQVSVTWTTMGLNIIWPRSVRGFWENRFFKTEPYANKQYNKGRWGIEKFLNITRQTFHRTFLDVSKYIQSQYLDEMSISVAPDVTISEAAHIGLGVETGGEGFDPTYKAKLSKSKSFPEELQRVAPELRQALGNEYDETIKFVMSQVENEGRRIVNELLSSIRKGFK